MNHRPTGLAISKAIPGFIQYKVAEGLSPNTTNNYERQLYLWLEYLGDMDVSRVTTRDLRDYLQYMRTEYKPRRITGNNQHKLSGKTINNIWATLSSFFSWASIEFDFPSPMKQVPRPKFTVAPVEPFSRENIEDLLKACDYCAETRPYNRRKFRTRRATAKRDRAIILTLLDTGLRATELCTLTVGDVDLKTGRSCGGEARPQGWCQGR